MLSKISPDCFNLHLGVAQSFTDSLFDKTSVWLIVFLVALTVVFRFSGIFFLKMIKANLALFNCLHLLYNTHIRLAYQKKILAWLSLLENHGIALLA
jgi:hypothetical protein